MADIIPGVPTPSDPSCALSYCSRVTAQVDCIKNIMQGTTACIDIQLFGSDGNPLDLNDYTDIQIQMFDFLGCAVANFWYPAIPSGSKGLLITILQETETDGDIVDKGMLRICLGSACTKIPTGNLFIEILLTEDLPIGSVSGTSPDVIGIPCFMVGRILESKIYINGSNTGCE